MFNRSEVRRLLAEFNFRTLFTEELGWNTPRTRPVRASLDSKALEFGPVAEKAGVVVLHCRLPDGASIPDRAGRVKLYRQISKLHHEHLVVYTDTAKTRQEWVWVRDERGKPLAPRAARWRKGGANEDLIQKLQHLAISIEMEEELTAGHVTAGQRRAFDVESAATKKFYDEFKKQHAAFLTLVKGIDDQDHREWYTSVMLNRLMFVYFVQRKGFLNGEVDYLQNRLERLQAEHGRDQFFSFYRFFLLRLFHEGLGGRNHSRELRDLLGTVPYLNGGLFDVHELERRYTDIQIPDAAFEAVFSFFKGWNWHLDDRPLRDTGEINPDVLGYIFEKYINQKQMGAYYTKEDITEYIGRNTVIPWLLDTARERCKVAFERDGMVWRLLRENPDRYLYPAVRQGVVDEQGNVIALPDAVAAGVDNVAERGGWNGPAPEAFALPTETWREHVARRTRTLEVRDRLTRGEVHDINELVTLNLNLQLFVEDVIFHSEGPELVRAFWHALAGHVGDVNRSNDESRPGITVLDPTCGSGAFLFAALNILRPLYDGCLDRMQSIVDEWKDAGEPGHPLRLREFRDVLARVNDTTQHPNRDYFVLKSIILNNLFGVDIMEEAVEICKLRLFLKLVAQVERDTSRPNQGLEPLPDIDFNIRAGNTLVGFATLDEVRRAVLGEGQAELMLGDRGAILQKIEEDAEQVDLAFQRFRQAQTAEGAESAEVRTQKAILRERLGVLDDTLDGYLAKEYGVDDAKSPKKFAEWQGSHRPFHWFVEFYGIMSRSGFDVIIGNPPYVDRTKLKGQYSPLHLVTEGARDIYAWVVERSIKLCSEQGRLGLIIPVSIASSASFSSLRDLVWKSDVTTWLSHFANRPGQLFEGAQNRLTILVLARGQDCPATFSTKYHRWDARREERTTLFGNLSFIELNGLNRTFHGLVPKVGSSASLSILSKLQRKQPLALSLAGFDSHPVWWVRVPGYFCQFFLRPPMAHPEDGGPARIRGEVNGIRLASEVLRRVAHAILNSSTYIQFYCAYTDGRHINPSDVKDFPVGFNVLDAEVAAQLTALSGELEASMHDSTSLWRKSGLLIESVNSPATKPIIDEIDRVLAQHYGFTNEELDFIINYDIKYRMGRDTLAGDDVE